MCVFSNVHIPSFPDMQLGLDDTRLHRINGIVVLLSFFMCRIMVFPFMYWKYGKQFGIPLHRVAFYLPLQCNMGNLAILVPQIYWFILLLRKANRLYLRQRKKGNGNKDTACKDWKVALFVKLTGFKLKVKTVKFFFKISRTSYKSPSKLSLPVVVHFFFPWNSVLYYKTGNLFFSACWFLFEYFDSFL